MPLHGITDVDELCLPIPPLSHQFLHPHWPFSLGPLMPAQLRHVSPINLTQPLLFTLPLYSVSLGIKMTPGVPLTVSLTGEASFIKALAGYQAGTSSHTMNPPFAPQEMWDPTVSMAMVTEKVQRLHLADLPPTKQEPQPRTHRHLL